MIFYDDGPELLERALTSLKKVTDRVLAVDGAYREFPHKDFLSKKENRKIAKALADEVITPDKEWYDEPTKRNAYLTLKSEKDYYLMLDADEEIIGRKPERCVHPCYRVSLSTFRSEQWLPAYYNRLFRHHEGMRYHLTHNNLVTPAGIALALPDSHIPICEDVTIKHYPGERSNERQAEDAVFEGRKEERLIVLPVMQATPDSTVKGTPMQVRYIAAAPYRGFDDVNGQSVNLNCRQGDLVYISREKWAQLQADFKGSWVLIKEIDNG